MIGKVEGRQGGLGRILVTNKGRLGGREKGRKEKGRGGGRRKGGGMEGGGWLCQYYRLQKGQGGKGNAH